jgi:hypothetical protein
VGEAIPYGDAQPGIGSEAWDYGWMAPSGDVSGRMLAAVDAAALMLFVLVGVRSHHDVGALQAVVRNLVPLEATWFCVALLMGTYRRPGLTTLIRTWVLAVPAGLLLRTLWVGSPSGAQLLTFLGVGLAFTLLFLLVGRWIAALIGRRVFPAGHRT